MSLVTVVARESFISLVTDGRVTDSENNSVVDENYCKYRKISDSILIAGVGSYVQCKQIMAIAINLFQAHLDIDVLAKQIKTQLVNDVPREINPGIKVSLVLTGLDSNNDVTVYIINNKSNELKKPVKPKGKATCIVITTDEDNDEYYNEINNLFYKHRADAPESFLAAQKEFNDYVARENQTVNTIHFNYLIKKS
ncbi:hypothetical protein [Priestia megaterium]|uniref:hypothetical protein n=1 Tax=Priestia megaterium TaxID=1404 RepID=UPI0005C58A2D|nr:hypothetical protein [Priestia megaterium]